MTFSGVPSLGRFELASRVVLDAFTGSWFVIGVSDGEEASLLGKELGILAEAEVPVVAVKTRDALVKGSHDHATDIVVLHAPIPLQDLQLDDARSLLQREHAAVLVVPAPEIVRLHGVAPHFASWAANRTFLVEEDRYLDQEDEEARLAALRERHGLSDEEFVARVERGDLLLEPEHAEWLVLLHRSDLLEGGS